MSNLTAEQLQQIEEKRLKALQLKQRKTTSYSTTTSPGEVAFGFYKNKKESKVQHDLPRSSTSKSSNECLKCSVVDDKQFVVNCKYSPKLISIFKTIPSRQYDPNSKGWLFSLSDYPFLESKCKDIGETLPPLDNAVLVNTVGGTTSAVQLNSFSSDTKNGKCYLLDRTSFEIDVPFDTDCVGLFKSLPTKSYNVNTRRWSFHLTDYNELWKGLKKISNVHVEPLTSTVLTIFKSEIAGGRSSSSKERVPDDDLARIIDNDFLRLLMPFQKEGVKFAVSRNGRILLADDMGLGKTVQSICIATYYREAWPLLVVCPSSVRLMWKEALLKWLATSLTADDISIVNSGRDVISHCQVSVVSFDLLTKVQKQFADKRFNIAIIDESHFIKNFKTARTRAVRDVVKHSKHLILLSGTPALSRPVELYTQVSLLRPDLFPNFHQFGIRYCAGKQSAWGWEYSGSSNMEELRLILEETVMLRRTKDNVLSQLPPKVRRAVAIDVGACKRSSKLQESFEKAHSAVEKRGLSGVEKHGALLQFFNETARVKLPAVKSYVLDLIEGGHKFLVFAHHKIVLDSLEDALVKKKCDYMRIDGSTPSEKRQSEVARFQERTSCKVALLSITAANMGINLHAAALVVFAELFWNPGILVQAEDRCYRIGQRDVVNVHYLVAKGTSDDYIWEMVKKKLSVLSQAGLNKSNFDDTESHQARSRTQNSILNYFHSEKGREPDDETGADDGRGADNERGADTVECDLSVSDEELLRLFENESPAFDDVTDSDSCSNIIVSSNEMPRSGDESSSQKRRENSTEAVDDFIPRSKLKRESQ